MDKYYIAWAREHRGLREPSERFDCGSDTVPSIGDIVESSRFIEYFVIRRRFEFATEKIRVEVSDTV